jgi:hypothetical protein
VNATEHDAITRPAARFAKVKPVMTASGHVGIVDYSDRIANDPQKSMNSCLDVWYPPITL